MRRSSGPRSVWSACDLLIRPWDGIHFRRVWPRKERASISDHDERATKGKAWPSGCSAFGLWLRCCSVADRRGYAPSFRLAQAKCAGTKCIPSGLISIAAFSRATEKQSATRLAHASSIKAAMNRPPQTLARRFPPRFQTGRPRSSVAVVQRSSDQGGEHAKFSSHPTASR